MNIALIGNYVPDGQQSMQRYAEMLRAGLTEAGHRVAMAVPQAVLNRRGRAWTWAGYLDKYWAGKASFAEALGAADVVHVCDHGNAPYVPSKPTRPYVVTCHDMLAVRGALGEPTDCPASFMGQFLQRSIVRGLKRAHAVACVSMATLNDVRRLLNGYGGKLVLAPNALNYPYQPLSPQLVRHRLRAVPGLGDGDNYVLHVGSNERRKNREGVLRAITAATPQWAGKIVFAGRKLDPDLRRLTAELGVEDRVVEVDSPDSELLAALYNSALALLFPSRFEGFGWPIVEAQASGCPVICGDREPFPEVTGGAAIMCHADDYAALARAIVTLAGDSSRRAELVAAGLANAARFDRATMVGRFVSLYEQLLEEHERPLVDLSGEQSALGD